MIEPFDNNQVWATDSKGSRKHGSKAMTQYRLRGFADAIEKHGASSPLFIWRAINAWHWALSLEEFIDESRDCLEREAATNFVMRTE